MLTGDILRSAARRDPRKTAIVQAGHEDDGAAITYGELDAAADRFANALLAAGLGAGSRLAILSPNVPDYAAVYFGAARSGAVLVNLSLRQTENDLAHVLDRARVELVVAAADRAASIASIAASLPRLARVVALGDARRPRQTIALREFLAGASATPPRTAVTADDPFCMTLTGGTTGFPKGVLVSHRARYASAVAATIGFGTEERDVVAVVTPLFHVAGLFVCYQPAVLAGAAAVFLPIWDPADFMTAVERHRVTTTMMVPTQLRDLLDHPQFDPGRLAGLRQIVYAGAPMSSALLDRLVGALPSVEFVENYGQSETGPLTVRRGWHLPDKAGSIGRPLCNVELAVVDEKGRPVPSGEVGEIVTRGDHLLSGYEGAPEETDALYRTGDGWCWTGDLATVDEDGFLALVDRRKDVIIAGGENIYPQEIENALYRHEAVAECAVFGVPDDRFGEVPAAHVILKPGARAPSPDELIAHCARHVARHKRPRRLEFVDSLPKTAVGKIQRSLVRAPYWEGRERKI